MDGVVHIVSTASHTALKGPFSAAATISVAGRSDRDGGMVLIKAQVA